MPIYNIFGGKSPFAPFFFWGLLHMTHLSIVIRRVLVLTWWFVWFHLSTLVSMVPFHYFAAFGFVGVSLGMVVCVVSPLYICVHGSISLVCCVWFGGRVRFHYFAPFHCCTAGAVLSKVA